MPEQAADTAAVVVIYRQIGELESKLQALRQAVPWILVIDNRELAIEGLRELAEHADVAYLHAANVGGLAGAYNRALTWLAAQHPQASHVTFLDEDSDPAALPAFLADAQTQRSLSDPRTAAVSPAYRDRATGLRGRYMWLRRFKLGFNPREFDDLREVAFVINSMSVWRLSAVRQLGAFNEALAVDHVDTEYCLRARHQGLHLYVNGRFEFPHSIGERRRYRFFGMEVQAGGHSAARRFMIARNTVWLARHWAWKEPAFAALCLMRLGYEAVGIVAAEEQSAPKLWALLRGVTRGLFWPMRCR